MLSPLVSVPLAAAIIIGYFLLRMLVLRSRPVAPGPATPDLRDEPPAVVNLLVNRMVDAPQVASATLLDLAARRVAELHQVADDAAHTLVRLRAALPAGGPAYEQRVAERVWRIAGDRLTPVTELVERHAEGGQHWQRRLVRDAVLDARRLGLIERTDRGCLPAFVAAGLAVAALLAPLLPAPDSARFGGVAAVLVLVWLVVSLVAALLLSAVSIGEAASRPDRYTAKGRQATAHWLGVAAWLRGHESMRDLPPAAVAVWDRYLAYGVALDALPHAVRVLDFERVGDRDVLWSTHTGQRRQVRVRYPGRKPLLGVSGLAAAQARLVWAVLTLPVWIALGFAALNVTEPYLRLLLLALIAVQVLRTAYRLIRASADLLRPARVDGTVLDVSVAGKQHSADEADRPGAEGIDVPDLPTHFFVVVDDGSGDVLRPWVVNRDVARGRDMGPPPIGPFVDGQFRPDPAALAAYHAAMTRPFFVPGDRVRLVGQRWSRFVRSLEPSG